MFRLHIDCLKIITDGNILLEVLASGGDLVSDDMPYQLDLFMSEQKREKLEKMDQVVDEIRARFGYQSIQRAFVYQDKLLAQLNARKHTVHPQGYFHG